MDWQTFFAAYYVGVILSFWVFGVIAFAYAWFMCVGQARFAGFLLGWIPSLIVGTLAGALGALVWPFTLLALAVGAPFFFRALKPDQPPYTPYRVVEPMQGPSDWS